MRLNKHNYDFWLDPITETWPLMSFIERAFIIFLIFISIAICSYILWNVIT